MPSDAVLQPWTSFLRRNIKVLGGMAAYATVPPLLNLVTSPPWPDRKSVAFLSSAAGYLLAVRTFVSKRTAPKSTLRASTESLARKSLAVMLVYIALCGCFLYDGGSSRNKVAGGFLLRTDVAQKIAETNMSKQDALGGEEYDAAKVWQPWTVTFMNYVFLGVWLLFIGVLSRFVATFVLYLQKTATHQHS
jgi:hypothetical protein